jgi:hypothetical protein
MSLQFRHAVSLGPSRGAFFAGTCPPLMSLSYDSYARRLLSSMIPSPSLITLPSCFCVLVLAILRMLSTGSGLGCPLWMVNRRCSRLHYHWWVSSFYVPTRSQQRPWSSRTCWLGTSQPLRPLANLLDFLTTMH